MLRARDNQDIECTELTTECNELSAECNVLRARVDNQDIKCTELKARLDNQGTECEDLEARIVDYERCALLYERESHITILEEEISTLKAQQIIIKRQKASAQNIGGYYNTNQKIMQTKKLASNPRAGRRSKTIHYKRPNLNRKQRRGDGTYDNPDSS